MPVIVLMCCTFVFNTSEFIPIGLLSDIAADFGITEARAGLLITVYAWVVALVSLPLMLAVARMECWGFSLRATCCQDFRLPMRC